MDKNGKKKKYTVLTPKSAIRDYNKKVSGFGDIMRRMRPLKQDPNAVMPEEQVEKPMTLDALLRREGTPATFSIKSALARKMGIRSYRGSEEQNEQLAVALQALRETEDVKKDKDFERSSKDKEYGIREKELAMKEKGMETSKMPTAEEIAEKIMNRAKGD